MKPLGVDAFDRNRLRGNAASSRDARTLAVLAGYAERGTRLPPVAQLAARLNCSASTAQASLTRLQDAGRVVLMQRGMRRVVTQVVPA